MKKPPKGRLFVSLVHHAHGFAYFFQGLVRDLVGAAIAFAQNVLHIVHIAHKLHAALADRSQEIVHAFGDVLLQLARTAVADLLGDLLLAATGAQRGRSDKG